MKTRLTLSRLYSTPTPFRFQDEYNASQDSKRVLQIKDVFDQVQLKSERSSEDCGPQAG